MAGLLLPWTRKNIFGAAPGLAKKKWGPVPVITLAECYALILMIFLFIAALFNPAAVGTFGVVTEGTVVVALILGVVIYFVMKGYYSRKGLDIALAFKEIPPE